MSSSPTAAVRDRQTTVISQDFLSTRFNLQRKTGHTCYLNIFLIYNFEELLECLAMSDLVLLTCYFLTKINFILQLYIYYIYKYIYTIYILYIYYVYILYILYIYIYLQLSGILQSNLLRASCLITQDLEPCKKQNLRWKVEYHNNSSFTLFQENKMKKFFKKYKMPYFGAF